MVARLLAMIMKWKVFGLKSMSVAKPQPEEFPLDKNPWKRRSDLIPVRFKVFWKEKIAPSFGNDHHNIIIPATINHTAWILGAQPSANSIKTIFNENNQKKVHIVSMLRQDERLLKEPQIAKLKKEGILTSQVSSQPWFDHGTLNASTSKNQTVAEMREMLNSFYKVFSQSKSKQREIFYCHCMAGKSRSLVATIAFIYFYRDKKQLFDFENWPEEIKNKIPQELQNYLKDDPTISEVAEFIKIRRPSVKKMLKMDGDQAGFLGLMALDHKAKDLKRIKQQEMIKLYEDAQNIGLMLKAPLDQSFRDLKDREEQKKNLAAVYAAYQKHNLNLLMRMVVPITSQIIAPIESDTFTNHFNELKPSEKARFAILLHELTQRKPRLNLGLLHEKSLDYAKMALEKIEQLTSGDLIELLETFGTKLNLNYENIIKKILWGNNLNRYHAGIQLAELHKIAQNNSDAKTESLIKKVIGKLSYREQINFVQHLKLLKDPAVSAYAKIIQNNYMHRWFPRFNHPLSNEELVTLENLCEKSKLLATFKKFKNFFNRIKSKLIF